MTNITLSLPGYSIKVGQAAKFRGPDGLRRRAEPGYEERNYLGATEVRFVGIPPKNRVITTFSASVIFTDAADRVAVLSNLGFRSDAQVMCSGGDGLFNYCSGVITIEMVSLTDKSARFAFTIVTGQP